MEGGRFLGASPLLRPVSAETTARNGGVPGVLTLAKLPITSDEPQRSLSSSFSQVPQQKSGDGCDISG